MSQALQKVKIEVNESGTLASSSTVGAGDTVRGADSALSHTDVLPRGSA